MSKAPFKRIVPLAALFALIVALAGVSARAMQEPSMAGTSISNYAEASYYDAEGTGYATVSPTVTITMLAVSSVVVTPDETEPSAVVSPQERVTRLFRVCNAGNTPDLYTITRAEVSAPAQLAGLHFDLDGSGTLTNGDRPVRVGSGLSPRLTRGTCVGLLAEIDTGDGQHGSLVTIGVTARSNVGDAANGVAQDDGTIINTYGSGPRLSSPDDQRLPPVKLVEGRGRVTSAYGQTLTYTVAFRNSGDVAARNVVVADELPTELEYVAGSLRLNAQFLTDAEDADAGRVVGRRLEVRVASVAVDELVQITFQARVVGMVPPGTGVVNLASVNADNAPAAVSTTAVAVVHPFGLVYEGRSNGTTPVPGALVRLLADSTGAQLLTLPPDAGSTPNERNENPFRADGQGRWVFAPAPDQLGSTTSPARYFLNVTANGYRSRMLELTVVPTNAVGLFSVAVRALDGQPVAKSGSFELTEDAVLLADLGAFVLNVPMFEHAALELNKAVDRQSVEVGDVVSYRLEVHNATSAALSNVTVRDLLPPSFHYASGSARVHVLPGVPQPVEPEVNGSELVFRLPSLAAGARALVTYRVRVGVNAGEGEQVNSAVVSGSFVTGETVSSSPSRASVHVRRGIFSMRQIIIGRVFEDANGNGLFDNGERPVAGVRLYLNNGQSVITDSAGQYNFPSVNDGSLVIALDPVTVPAGYYISDGGTRDGKTWTRLLRTPLGGGGMLRQNFALRPSQTSNPANVNNFASSPDNFGTSVSENGKNESKKGSSASNKRNSEDKNGSYESNERSSTSNERSSASNKRNSGDEKGSYESSKRSSESKKGNSVSDNGTSVSDVARSGASDSSLASGTYEMAATDSVAPVSPGMVQIVSPSADEVVGNAALEVVARVAESWTVALDLDGERIPDAKIAVRRVDRHNHVATFTFVGLNVRPGPNRIRATAVSPEGKAGQAVEMIAFGRGPARRLEIVPERAELSAGGRDSTLVRVRAFDQWNNPAADGTVLLEASAGRLLAVRRSVEEKKEKNDAKSWGGNLSSTLNGAGTDATNGTSAEQVGDNFRSQTLTLVNGEGLVHLIADNTVGVADLHAQSGTITARSQVRITPEIRSSILVGLAEISVGKAAPEMTLRNEEGSVRSQLAFFFRGPLFGTRNLLTLAYDSQRPLNRNNGNDRLFQLDPLDRAYPVFGDSSTRYEDAQSNSKLYARVDRGRSYAMFGDFETEHKGLNLAGYARKMTGVKLHVENSEGDYVSVTGARPDTGFARDVFPGGVPGILRLTHTDVMPGSEVVVLEVRDRRNPEIIISREQLVRSVDYNIMPSTGEIFLLRFISTFDYALNLTQIVVTYEHRAAGLSSAVYTARAVKNFEGVGLRLGVSFVDQQQSDLGSFVIGGVDGEKTLPNGGSLQFEWATSRGRVMAGGNVFGASGDRHDGNAVRVELLQPLEFKSAVVRASYSRADEGFLNPFGASVTPGSQRAGVGVDMKPRASSLLSLSLMDERNRTVNVNNRRLTGSLKWQETLTDRLRFTLGYDFRRLNDSLGGNQTNSNLVSAGVDWQATDKLELSVKREQNLGEADPTYPNQTTLAATYQWNQWTRIFLTQRLASAPIVPISDAGVTGFAATGARRETAIGVETRLGRHTSLNSRYQLENGINGSDSFAVIGLANRLPVSKTLALDFSFERGFHIAGSGESFNSIGVGASWMPVDTFRASGRYEMRDRGGLGSVITLGAAGRLSDNLTALARFQRASGNVGVSENSSLNMTAAVAWRPVESDRVGLLFSYTRRELSQSGGTLGSSFDRADILSSDAYWRAARNLELYGRFALKYNDNGTAEYARVSALTYMMQGRAAYRLGRYFDVAGETRMLLQPMSSTRRTSYGAEIGFWLMPDLRLGGGYNFTSASEPAGSILIEGRQGFYFTISSKLSNLFDLFGTTKQGAATGSPMQQTTSGEEKR